MRRLIVLLTAFGSLLAMSCGGGKQIKFADFQYQLACHEMGGCVAMPYNINDSDGNGSVVIHQCLVSHGGTNPSLAFNVSNVDTAGQPFSIKLASGFFNATTHAAIAGACNLTVTQGASSYTGNCGPNPPSPAQPCQITGIMETLTPTDMANPDPYPQIVGDILCQHLQSTADSTILREVESTGAVSGHSFHFRIVFCDGAMPM